jgi:site-specific DNA recombinase
MSAGIYARLSVLKASERLTEAALERQEEDCRELCARRGWNVIKVYPDEGISAYQKRKRPGFEQAMADLEAGVIDVLVVYRLDRLVRRLRDWVRVEEVVERSGRKVVSVNEGEQSQLTLRILASMGEQESRNTSERVRRQQRQAAVAGGPPPGGRRLFGYSKRRETIIEDEARVVRELARRLLAGESVRQLTRWANTVSLSTTGRPWSQRTLRDMLMSPGLAGRRIYQGTDVAAGRWTPILDMSTHEMVVAILNDPTRRKRGRGGKHLLSGLVHCGRCEAQMITHYEPKARGGRRQYWCPSNKGLGRPGCGKTTVTAAGLEAVVSAMVLKRLAGPGLAKALAARDREAGTGVAAELAAVYAQIAEVEGMWKARQIKGDAFLRLHTPLVEQQEHLQGRLRQGAEFAVLAELPNAADELDAWWTAADIDQRRAVVEAVVSRVLVGPALGPSRTFDAARLKPPFGPHWRA